MLPSIKFGHPLAPGSNKMMLITEQAQYYLLSWRVREKQNIILRLQENGPCI